nr:hypothetical protein [Tanacetum cinerariifolium]
MKPAGLLQPLPISERVWEDISMDFIEGLPVSNGFSVVMVVVDRLSKYAHFIPLKQPFTAAGVAREFITNVVRLYGIPSIIVSDRDKAKNRHRRDLEFKEGKFVLVKLQPYRQVSVANRLSVKLSPSFSGCEQRGFKWGGLLCSLGSYACTSGDCADEATCMSRYVPPGSHFKAGRSGAKLTEVSSHSRATCHSGGKTHLAFPSDNLGLSVIEIAFLGDKRRWGRLVRDSFPSDNPQRKARVALDFITNVVRLHGIPSTIVSDRDKLPPSNGRTDGSRESDFGTVPMMLLYGRLPFKLVPYIPGTASVQEVDEYLQDRDSLLKHLRKNLLNAQDHMKANANRHRRDLEFKEGEFVLVKLQPYRQVSVANRLSVKLSPRYYGAYEVLARVGPVAYKIKLPPSSLVPDVFHVSLLRRFIGPLPAAVSELKKVPEPLEIPSDPQPENILEERVITKGKYRPKTEDNAGLSGVDCYVALDPTHAHRVSHTGSGDCADEATCMSRYVPPGGYLHGRGNSNLWSCYQSDTMDGCATGSHFKARRSGAKLTEVSSHSRATRHSGGKTYLGEFHL